VRISLDGRPFSIACGQIDYGNVVSAISVGVAGVALNCVFKKCLTSIYYDETQKKIAREESKSRSTGGPFPSCADRSTMET